MLEFFAIFKPAIDKNPASGIANKGIKVAAIEENLPNAINKLPVKSPNLVTKVSMNTEDLYLSFLPNSL